MEVGRRIREQRTDAGMSQDELAARVYVSRQTISSWENDKTYPDLQSLLLLSEIFGVAIDTLIKGDVETMTTAVRDDARLMKRLGLVMFWFLALEITTMVWWLAQNLLWDWAFEQTIPTLVLTFALWGVAMGAGVWTDRLKRANDLATYREISDFLEGRSVNRDTEKGRRVRARRPWPSWAKVALVIGAPAVGFAAGVLIAHIANLAIGAL